MIESSQDIVLVTLARAGEALVMGEDVFSRGWAWQTAGSLDRLKWSSLLLC